MAKAKKVPVSERAILARINRKISVESRQIKKCRQDSNGFDHLGHYYEVNLHTNTVTDRHVDLERLAKSEGVLKDYETVDFEKS
jgi:hypothetical protein